MNIGTTSIDSLPTSPQQLSLQQQMPMQQQQQQPAYSADNIRLEMNTNIKVDNPAQTLQHNREADPAIAQKNMNQFITGIQQASAAGLTALPSRDIPQMQDQLVQDQQIKPNYIPQQQQQVDGRGSATDYISNYKTREDIVRENAQKQHSTDSLDALYNEFQIPLLLGVLYFLFQLPVVRKSMFKYIPLLFQKDGNLNLGGYISNSILFGLAYYVVMKFITHFSL
jgi:hypothetical protein